jgi:hypothetical protein
MLDGRSLAELARLAACKAERLARGRRGLAEQLVERERHTIEDYVGGTRQQSRQRLVQLDQRLAEARQRLQQHARTEGTLSETLAAARATLHLLEGERRHAQRQLEEDEQRLERERAQALGELEALVVVRRQLTPLAFARFEFTGERPDTSET